MRGWLEDAADAAQRGDAAGGRVAHLQHAGAAHREERNRAHRGGPTGPASRSNFGSAAAIVPFCVPIANRRRE